MILPYKDEFEKNKYTIIRDFFSQKDTKRMADRMDFLFSRGMLVQDPQCPKSYSMYGDPIQSEMQEMYRYKLGELIGIDLFPTYTYSRIYAPKEVLAYHSDRPSCEISITGTLMYDTFDNEPWDIWMGADESNKNAQECEIWDEHEKKIVNAYGIPYKLYPGDIVVYRGCEVKHWRTQFIGIKQSQVFIHYVNANGPYKDYKYDCRPSLGSSVGMKDECKLKELNSVYDNGVKSNEDKTIKIIR